MSFLMKNSIIWSLLLNSSLVLSYIPIESLLLVSDLLVVITGCSLAKGEPRSALRSLEAARIGDILSV